VGLKIHHLHLPLKLPEDYSVVVAAYRLLITRTLNLLLLHLHPSYLLS
jgi:hypothetical protein